MGVQYGVSQPTTVRLCSHGTWVYRPGAAVDKLYLLTNNEGYLRLSKYSRERISLFYQFCLA